MSDEPQFRLINPGVYTFGEDITILVAGPEQLFVGFNRRKFTMRDIDNYMQTIQAAFPDKQILAISGGSGASFTPLGESQELRDLIREIVEQELGPDR